MTEANTPKTSTITCPHCEFQSGEEMSSIPAANVIFISALTVGHRDNKRLTVGMITSERSSSNVGRYFD
jgi:hypothetical protein